MQKQDGLQWTKAYKHKSHEITRRTIKVYLNIISFFKKILFEAMFYN